VGRVEGGMNRRGKEETGEERRDEGQEEILDSLHIPEMRRFHRP